MLKEDDLDLGTKWWNGLMRAYTWVFMMLECISATPLTAWDPTMHRCAMFTLLHPSSSIRDIFLSLSMSSGKATAILCRGRFRLTCQRRVPSIKKKSVFLWRLKQVYVHRGGPGWSGRWSAGVWAGGSPAAPRASAPEPRGGLCGWCRRKCAWWGPRPAGLTSHFSWQATKCNFLKETADCWVIFTVWRSTFRLNNFKDWTIQVQILPSFMMLSFLC